ncbi:MAG: diaminopimelate epimerase [Granulosicoccus sp.]
MTGVDFTKMHGLGNDFMVIDNRDGSIGLNGETVRRWSDRHTGIGFDQLLVVNAPSVEEAEFDYQIFNADGEEVEHCGNGARCFARFVTERQLTKSRSINVNTALGIITLQLQHDDQVMVKMGVPQFEPQHIPFIADKRSDFYALDVDGQHFEVGAASIGNPHVLIRVDDLHIADVERIGQLVERHERFPNRVNVGFMQIMDWQHIRLRVFERGVGETRACGTGACAAVAIAHSQGLLDKTAIVSLPGGDLKIDWPNVHASIEMTGPCSTVFEGQTRM